MNMTCDSNFYYPESVTTQLKSGLLLVNALLMFSINSTYSFITRFPGRFLLPSDI